jgi:hypothetical protein
VKVAVKAAATVADAVAGVGAMVAGTVAAKAAVTANAAKAERIVANAAKAARQKLPVAKRAATLAAKAVVIAASAPSVVIVRIVVKAAAVVPNAPSALPVKTVPVSRPSTQRAAKSAHRERAVAKAEVNRAVKVEARAAVARALIVSPAVPTRWLKALSWPKPCRLRRLSTPCPARMRPRAAMHRASVRAHVAATAVAVGAVVTATMQRQAPTTTRPQRRLPKQRISLSTQGLNRVKPRQRPRPHAAKALTVRRKPVKAAAGAEAVTAIVGNAARKRWPTSAQWKLKA